MTVLNDVLIKNYCEAGMVKPFTPERVNPASIDLCFSGRYKKASDKYHYSWPADFVENWTEIKNNLWGETIEEDNFIMYPGSLILADTLEYITMPQNLAGTLMLKSSLGRMGLEHLHAGWFDPGFSGTATLELKNVAPWPVLLKKGQPIVQLIFYECYPPAVGYDQTGSYNGQSSPQPAK